MSVVIQVDRLSKQYRLGVINAKRLKDDVNRWVAKLRGKEDPLSKVNSSPISHLPSSNSALPSPISHLPTPASPSDVIWALKDVSFEVKQGEVVGIIGRNGAGKSTLLKILSQVTTPTSGEVRIKGRIASLLEVGTGFQPDMSGRENIFLNGAILGMTKAEIRRKFDEIVAFSEVEKFIDTPVKRYSSGMYVRLAFAVAAHLEPEILIVDEVLAVGDAEFQKKCLGKMQEVSGEGRTVLFVSHNMPSVLRLCARAFLLSRGRLEVHGPTAEVVGRYISETAGRNEFQPNLTRREGDGGARVVGLRVEPNPPRTGAPVTFFLDIQTVDPQGASVEAELAVGIRNEQGGPILQLFSGHMAKKLRLGPGHSCARVSMSYLPLAEGHYEVSVWVGIGGRVLDFLKSCFQMTVRPGQLGSGRYTEFKGYPVVFPSVWEASENAQVVDQ